MIVRSRKFKCPPSDAYPPVDRAAGRQAPTSAERRTLPLPFVAPAPAAPRPAKQLGLALALGVADDQLVMPGYDDDGTDPHRVYCPQDAQQPGAGASTSAVRKDGAR